ncbi:MAG: IMP dehydrogenase [Acidimicrobiales bacterium]|nr:IMP dehydrogenase [Acidimicrobiales bacterium]
MAEIQIGQGKSGRRGIDLADVSIVPARRTRDRGDVDLSWKIDAYRFALPFVAAGIERPLGTDDAIAVGEQGALALIDLEAIWAETPDPGEVSAHIAKVKSADVRVAVSVSASHVEELGPHAIAGEADILVIQGDVVSAETVSSDETTLNLKTFIRRLDIPVIVGGCGSYSAALHLMRTGAAGVIVGVDLPDLGVGVPLASAIGDARSARVRHLDETGVYCHIIARGPIASGADVARAVACGADAVLVDASVVVNADPQADDVVGNLRAAMATCGYTDLKAFQKAEVVVR